MLACVVRKLGYHFLCCVCTFMFVISASAKIANAQQAQAGSLLPVVSAVSHTPHKTVVVFDFFGPSGLNALGAKVADDLQDRLRSASHGDIQIIDRSGIPETLFQLGLGREDASEAFVEDGVAQQLGADAFISGHIEVKDGKVVLSFRLQETDVMKWLGEWSSTFPLDAESQNLLASTIRDSPFSNFPWAGSRGYKAPTCVFCPSAEFTIDAKEHHTSGIVLVLAIVEPDGKLTKTRVLRGLPDGLNNAALRALRDWKLKPANGPDGKPTAVREVIEVVFHLY